MSELLAILLAAVALFALIRWLVPWLFEAVVLIGDFILALFGGGAK